MIICWKEHIKYKCCNIISYILKLYIYGYLNRIQSSRRLERESQRNLELIWLIERLTPDFKTIANFRKDEWPCHS